MPSISTSGTNGLAMFQNRYKSVVCEEDSYLLELIRYIHLNPLRAGLVRNLDALDLYCGSVGVGPRQLVEQAYFWL